MGVALFFPICFGRIRTRKQTGGRVSSIRFHCLQPAMVRTEIPPASASIGSAKPVVALVASNTRRSVISVTTCIERNCVFVQEHLQIR